MRVLTSIMSCRPSLLGSARLPFTTTSTPTTTSTTTLWSARRTATTTTTATDSGYGSHWKSPESRNGDRLIPPQFSHPGRSTTSVHEDSSRQYQEQIETAFYGIIQDAQPEQVINAMLDPRCAELVASMPQSTFVEALHLLSPRYFVVPYREIHRPLHPMTVHVKGYKSLGAIFDDFADRLAAIVQLRQSAGHVLGLAEYTHLLDCARSIGDAVMADMVWRGMRDDGVVPDVQCYNYYMEAKVGDAAYTGKEKYNLRMTPFAYRKRRYFDPNAGWQGYGTAARSVRKEVLQIFNEMTEEGNHGDEETFVNVILACSRVGHAKGIKNILKTAWNIDVDALLEEGDDSMLPPATYYDPSSPLHPTERLLFAVVHALGTNNDISAALRTIEFIANSYNLTVPEKVWLELFERSFVLSRPRFGPDAKRNAKGKVSYDFVNFMFQTMTSAPYDVRPTIEVHHIMAKTAWDRDRLSEFLRHMRAAYEILSKTRQQRKKTRSILEGYLSAVRAIPQQKTQILQSRGFADALLTYDILRLRTAQQTTIMERLARLLMINNRWTGRNNPAWERYLLPRAIEEWQDFLPDSFVYFTRGGLVKFHGSTHWHEPYLNTHRSVPVRRRVDDNEDMEEEAREIDDEFFWEECRQLFPFLDFDSPPLDRLFRRSCGASLPEAEDDAVQYGSG